MAGSITWFGYRILKPCVWVGFVWECSEGVGGTGGWGRLRMVETVKVVKEFQQVTVIGTLLLGNKDVEVPHDVTKPVSWDTYLERYGTP